MDRITIKDTKGLPYEAIASVAQKYNQYAKDIEEMTIITYKNLKLLKLPRTEDFKEIRIGLLIISVSSFIQFHKGNSEKHSIYNLIWQSVYQEFYRMEGPYDEDKNVLFLRSLFDGLHMELSLSNVRLASVQ
ncbi:unnamed protein product [Cunninghamella echinulata]